MVDLSSFNDLLFFTQSHCYFLIFLIMVVEGPIITAAAAFASSLGYFNLWIILFLSFLGDFTGDMAIYLFGRYGRKKFVYERGSFFGIKTEKLKGIESHFENHFGKTLYLSKMTPLAVPTIFLAGMSHVPVKKFALWSFLSGVHNMIVFAGIGYFFGSAAGLILGIYKHVGWYIVAFVIIVAFVYLLGKFISKRIMKSRL